MGIIKIYFLFTNAMAMAKKIKKKLMVSPIGLRAGSRADRCAEKLFWSAAAVSTVSRLQPHNLQIRNKSYGENKRVNSNKTLKI